MKFTNDLVIENGDMVLVDHEQAIGQAIRDRLSTFRGEWFLDTQFGPDYRDEILVKNPPLELVTSILKDEILKSVESGGESGVFTDFNVEYSSDRELTISYEIIIGATDVVLSDTITV